MQCKNYDFFISGIFLLIFLDHGRPWVTETTECEPTHDEGYYSFLDWGREQGGRVPPQLLHLPRVQVCSGQAGESDLSPAPPSSHLAAQSRVWPELSRSESAHLVTGALQLIHLGHKLKQVQDPLPRQMAGDRGLESASLVWLQEHLQDSSLITLPGR